MKSEAIWTKAKGKDIITEIREPFGSGIDQVLEAVAIRRSFCVHNGRFHAFSANAESVKADDAEN